MANLRYQKVSNFIENLPTPLAGLMLAFATNGNMLRNRSEYIRYIFGAVALIIFILLLLKSIFYFRKIKEDFKNPALASVMPTFSMATMVLSTYIWDKSALLSEIVWYMGFSLHVILIVAFSLLYLKNFKKEEILPSWYIVYVGIAVAAVTGSKINLSLAQMSFYFGLISYIILIPFVFHRVIIRNDLNESIEASKAIIAAPGALCLSAYLSVFANKNYFIVIGLFVISQFFYFLFLTELRKILSLGFYPSFSALTFPTAITAHSVKLFKLYNTQIGIKFNNLDFILVLEELLAVILCLYVFYKYMKFFKMRLSRVESN